MIFAASLFFINPIIMCEVEFLEDLLWFSQFPHYLYRPDNFMLFWVFRRFIMILAASLFFINPIIMCWNSYDKFLAYLLWLDNVIYFTDNNVLKDLLWWFCGPVTLKWEIWCQGMGPGNPAERIWGVLYLAKDLKQ